MQCMAVQQHFLGTLALLCATAWTASRSSAQNLWRSREAGMHAAALRVACGFVALGAACGPLNSAADGFLPRFLLVSCWLFSIGPG